MYRWPVLTEVAAATRAGDGTTDPPPRGARPGFPGRGASAAAPARSAADVIQGRRSARRFDARHALARDDFFDLLRVVAPATSGPWDALARLHGIDLVLFVHRVDGLDPGFYLFNRTPAGTPSLASRLALCFDLPPVAGAPADLDLRVVEPVAQKQLTRFVRGLHCHQDIAAQACFALGMVAALEAAIEQDPAGYRALHREAGLIGHALYLAAEDHGLGATGIGCFFDDTLHELLRLPDARFQTLYHFAVGKPIDDAHIEMSTARCPYLSG
jgi:nitroreductase